MVRIQCMCIAFMFTSPGGDAPLLQFQLMKTFFCIVLIAILEAVPHRGSHETPASYRSQRDVVAMQRSRLPRCGTASKSSPKVRLRGVSIANLYRYTIVHR